MAPAQQAWVEAERRHDALVTVEDGRECWMVAEA
jgi:hypothetical protein